MHARPQGHWADEAAGLRGEHDHPSGGNHLNQGFHHLQAAAVGEGQIEDQHVGAVLPADGLGLGNRESGADDVETFVGAQHSHKQLLEHHLVFNNDTSERKVRRIS